MLWDAFPVKIDRKVQLLLGQFAFLAIVDNAREIKLERNTAPWESFENGFRLRLQFRPYRIDCLIEACNDVVDPLQASAMMGCGEVIKHLLPELANGRSRPHQHQ